MRFRFKLKNRLKKDVFKIAQSSKDNINNSSTVVDFDKEKTLEIWEATRSTYKDLLLQEIIQTYAISNALTDTNNILKHSLNMKNGGISETDFNQILYKLFTIKMYNVLVKNSDISDVLKNNIMERITAKQFPVKDSKQQSNTNYIKDVKRQVENYISHDEPVDYEA